MSNSRAKGLTKLGKSELQEIFRLSYVGLIWLILRVKLLTHVHHLTSHNFVTPSTGQHYSLRVL